MSYKHIPGWEKFKEEMRKRQEEADIERWHQEEETELNWAMVSTQDIIELRNIVKNRARFTVFSWVAPFMIVALMFIISGLCKTSGFMFGLGILIGGPTFGASLWQWAELNFRVNVRGVPGMTLNHLDTLVEARTLWGEQYATFDGESVLPYPGSYRCYEN